MSESAPLPLPADRVAVTPDGRRITYTVTGPEGALPVVVVAITTALQRRTPGPVQGRVFTAFEFLAGGPQLLSIAAGAALVAVVDYRVLLVVMATGLLVGAGYGALRLHDAVTPDEPASSEPPSAAPALAEPSLAG